MTKSAAQRVIDYFCGHPMGCDTVTIVKDLRREDRQRRQMKRAILESYEASCECATCKLARRLRKEAK